MTQTGTVISDLNSHFSSLTSAYQGRIKLMNVFYPSERKSVCVCVAAYVRVGVCVCVGVLVVWGERESKRCPESSTDQKTFLVEKKITFSDCYQELGFFS